MGSRLMHLIIAHIMTERFPIEDQTSFLLGSIAPDASSHKEVSHFFKGNVDELEEVSSKEVEAFLPYIAGDMKYNLSVLNEPLNVFTLNQIIGYIETSATKGTMAIHSLLKNQK